MKPSLTFDFFLDLFPFFKIFLVRFSFLKSNIFTTATVIGKQNSELKDLHTGTLKWDAKFRLNKLFLAANLVKVKDCTSSGSHRRSPLYHCSSTSLMIYHISVSVEHLTSQYTWINMGLGLHPIPLKSQEPDMVREDLELGNLNSYAPWQIKDNWVHHQLISSSQLNLSQFLNELFIYEQIMSMGVVLILKNLQDSFMQ